MSQVFTSSMDCVDVTFYLQDRKPENPVIVDPTTTQRCVTPVTGLHLDRYDLLSRHVVILSKADQQKVSSVLRDYEWVQFFRANRAFLSEEEFPQDFPESDKRGKSRDIQKAITILTDLSDRLQFPPAQNSLAFCYYWGLGVEKNDERMFNLLFQAAGQGFAVARRNLGWCYQEGKGIEKSFRAAFYMYKDALEGGMISALCDLARLYEAATPPNIHEAERLYRYAASLGLVEAKKRVELSVNESSDIDSLDHIEGFPVGTEIDIFQLMPQVQALMDKVQQLTQKLAQKDQQIADMQKQLQAQI
ncbi:MAG: sel1 repeat family protein [Alphaproteobacteria bacterium]|jgi:TPR repeat protein|nr:sel1 repeat family protein [Alphaproteobacteria bacterium]MBP9877643.1 sel1 repeat family protein [Alphaproteobacteria bacterium]